MRFSDSTSFGSGSSFTAVSVLTKSSRGATVVVGGSVFVTTGTLGTVSVAWVVWSGITFTGFFGQAMLKIERAITATLQRNAFTVLLIGIALLIVSARGR